MSSIDDQNCERLLAYLRSILFDREIQALDPAQLDPPFQNLGRGMQVLQSLVEEMLAYSAELSRGNLSVQQPEKDNLLCTNLKNMHATLNHLTWQAKQVAAGDYSQHISYLGEFSDAFNTMTRQLQEREATLLREAAHIRQHSEELSTYNELLLQLTANSVAWILVIDAATHEVIYCNLDDSGSEDLTSSPCAGCRRRHPGHEQVFAWNGTSQAIWELHPTPDRYFQVRSFPVTWQERQAYVHVLTDITEQHREKDILSRKAYLDPVTSLRNRAFFEDYLDLVLRDGQPLTMGYLDLDGLKYVNDHFGHTEGDHYITRFAAQFRNSFRRSDVVVRLGGDEFCVLMLGEHTQLLTDKLEQLRTRMMQLDNGLYTMSFSYGVCTLDGIRDRTDVEAALQKVDAAMYDYKRAHKRARP